MFQFTRFAFMTYVFSHKYLHLISVSPKTCARHGSKNPLCAAFCIFGITEIEGGFPHSEIRGSKVVRTSPRLIAAYHVLHRLSAPRHPPNTLKALDRSHYRRPPLGSGCRIETRHGVNRKDHLLQTYPGMSRSSHIHGWLLERLE